jgi:hypothetical protein
LLLVLVILLCISLLCVCLLSKTLAPIFLPALLLRAALLVCLRNWVYLVCVAYKVARRLAPLAFHGPLERLSGTLLTFLGMWLGLWQSLGYAALDLAVDVALVKLQVRKET